MAAKGDLDVTVFRPSVIFGLGDSFLSMFAKVLKKAAVLPARFRPCPLPAGLGGRCGRCLRR
jgi:hypothetical protein